MAARFTPPFPPRDLPKPLPWAGFFGERARTAVYGWSNAAFERPHLRFKVLRFTVHIPLAPAAVQRVLLDNAGNYAKPGIVKRLGKGLIGRGLLTSDGDLWREQRRIVAANFVPGAIEALIPSFARVAKQRLARWAPGTRDMAEEATAATMAVIADALFAGDARLKTARAMRHIAAALSAGGETRLLAVLGLPMIEWNRRMRAARRGQEYLRSTLADVVRERLSAPPRDDFLGRLIAALGERFDDREALTLAVDNAATFYLAGHETTANAVTWAVYLLSEQPGLQERAAEEAKAALDAGEDDSALPDRLPLLRRILDETLRLYPSVPRFDREALGSDRLGEWEVGEGDIVSLWPWLIHRHRSLWDDPDAFDPDRFGPGAPERHRFQYIPFGGGPRVCVGARFATAEALTVMAHWLARWRLSPLPGRKVEPGGQVTLRPKGGLPLILERRD
ncbi:MAG: cytochrome P450 [Sphingomonadaceae bacterium]